MFLFALELFLSCKALVLECREQQASSREHMEALESDSEDSKSI